MTGKTQLLYKTAKNLIPGGTQLLSKKPERFLPDLWPAYYEKAKGCTIYDLDGKKYLDMSLMGIGASILGYADSDVDKKVKKAIDKGSMSTLNCPEEVELAKLLCKIHPWAQMARFARTGGEAAAVAVRIARAWSNKDKVLFCGYHGWHDWYISANLSDDASLDGHLLPGLKPRGVPRGLANTAIPFSYNDTDGFLKAINKHKGEIAAVIMEPLRSYYPKKGFLETIRRTTADMGIALIFDEITSGWRLCVGGAHLLLGIKPDMCVFGKAMSNGYPMSAIIGKRDIMDVAQDTFISSTYWTERIGPVAALATIRKLKKYNVPLHLKAIGKMVQRGWSDAAKKHGLKIKTSGIYPLSHFSFDYKEPLVLKTLFSQMMLEKGFLASTALYASYAHKRTNIRKYLVAVDKVFLDMASAIKKGKPDRYLKSSACYPDFRRLV